MSGAPIFHGRSDGSSDAGKFAPFYPVPDLIDAYARLREYHPGF